MSYNLNYKLWIATKKNIELVLRKQNILKKLPPITKSSLTYRIFSELYVLYIDIVAKLGYIYQNTYQVQKRKVVRDLLEATIRRLQEMKNELKNIELNEYMYIDKALIAKKLTPYDLMIWRSSVFACLRPTVVEDNMYENNILNPNLFVNQEIEKSLWDISAAAIVIQAHERARQARVNKTNSNYNKTLLKVSPLKEIKYCFTHKTDQLMSIPVRRTLFTANYYKKEDTCQYFSELKRPTLENEESFDEILIQKYNDAAKKIQSMWKTHTNKKELRMSKVNEEQTLKMKLSRKPKKKENFIEILIENYKKKIKVEKLEEDFIKLLTNERIRLLQERSPWIMEDISDHIRDWFREFNEKVGDFHPYPDEVKNGTVLVVLDESMTPLEYRESLQKKQLTKAEKQKIIEKLREKKLKEKEKIKKEKIKEAKRRKKMKLAGIFDISDELTRNKNIEIIQRVMKQFSIDWQNIDEYLNKTHKPIMEWIVESEVAVVHRELRSLVDEVMRIEFELLRKALAADLKQKYKPQKIKRTKSKKPKRKKTKDISSQRNVQSMYEELKELKIIHKFNNQTFEEYISEFNFVADNTRNEHSLTTLKASKGDIKMVIQDCLFGMGEFTVEKPKSICLVGPFNNGKTMLCEIIASELDAIFIDLSPEHTSALTENLSYYLKMILKVAKAFQPTIIFIQNVHRVFWKKVPPDQQHLNPQLLQKALIKSILKPLKKDDKVMILGTTDTPWAAKGSMKKLFSKILLLTQNDYGTSFLLWLELLARNGGDGLEDYMTTALAKVLQGYTSGDVKNNVLSTLNVNRRMRLNFQQIDPNEFLETFIESTVPMLPLDEKLNEKYEKWFTKANSYAKMRRKFEMSKINKKK